MNKHTSHLFLPLVQALIEGKTIQYKSSSGVWNDAEGNIAFSFDPENYRVKPESKKAHVVVRENESVVRYFDSLSMVQAFASIWNKQIGKKAYTVKTFVMVEEKNNGNC